MDVLTVSELELEDSVDAVLISDVISAAEELMESELDCEGAAVVGDGTIAIDVLTVSTLELGNSSDAVLVGDGISATKVLMVSELGLEDCEGVAVCDITTLLESELELEGCTGVALV
jgi:hypothetical protein